MLLFKKKFLPAIRSGAKRQTIRVWPRRMMRTGQRSYIPGIGYIRIVEVAAVSLDELTDEDAVKDGFTTLAELKTELQQLYLDKLAAGHEFFRLRFELLPGETKRTAVPS